MDPDIEEKMEELKEKLHEVFGENAEIHGFSAKSFGDVVRKAHKFMNDPILTIKCSRVGCGIEANKCNTEEIRNAVEEAIAHMLEMFPKDWRNDILYQSIQLISDEHDEGSLFEEDK